MTLWIFLASLFSILGLIVGFIYLIAEVHVLFMFVPILILVILLGFPKE